VRSDRSKRRSRCGGVGPGAGLAGLLAALVLAATAQAASPPQVEATWATDVAAKSARLHAELKLDPALQTGYHFNYLTAAEYEANLGNGKEGFAGAKIQPPADATISAGASEASVVQLLSNLAPETAYRYRVVAKNSAGTVSGPTKAFITQALGGGVLLPDGRGWKMVSPIEKNGGQVDGPGENAGGDVLQAAADGDSVTYSSSASFGEAAQGAPPASQYISRRGAGGWSTENITAALLSGSYGTEPDGVPYRIFSGDLARGLLLNGHRCRSDGEDCAVANPPLPGTGAPSGYQNYYLRDDSSGGFEALLTQADVLATALSADRFEVSLAGATPDLDHVVLASCAKLTANATEAPAGEGCDPAAQNLYLWSGSGLTLLNLLPAQAQGTPGAELAAQSGAISADGTRVYWKDLASGNLYLRSDGQTKQVDAAAGGGGSFESASADGSLAFFSKAGHLYRYDAATGLGTDLTPAGGAQGVLGASAAGDYLYYQDGGALKLWHAGTTTTVAPGAGAANPSDYPPATGTARVSADGARLAFLSKAPLTGYDNTGPGGEALSEAFLYDAAAGTLTCASCNPTNARPLGPSTIPGATQNGSTPGSTRAYKPRVLVAGGSRLYFDSEDSLVPADTNASPDVYQWEAQGTGSCAKPGGCVNLISSGKAELGAFFVDASADGSDAFFRTDQSLVPSDPGSIDLYDARIGGGFPIPTPPLPCVGDACQSLPPEPIDPVLNTLVEGSGNPAVRFYDTNRHRPRYHRLRDHHHKGRKQGGRGKRRHRGRG
jgi:hypothetical protein